MALGMHRKRRHGRSQRVEVRMADIPDNSGSVELQVSSPLDGARKYHLMMTALWDYNIQLADVRVLYSVLVL